MTEEVSKLLRSPFPANQIGKLPKPFKKDSAKGQCDECGGWHGLPAAHLDYVGHAAITHRLLDADPAWSWEPLSLNEQGLPTVDSNGGLWIKLTVGGITRLGYGDAQGKTGGDAMKERIGDALRNAAMRFGVALELWHKGDLHAPTEEELAAARKEAREDWLKGVFANIDGATNSGALRQVIAAATAVATRENDLEAIELVKKHANEKVAAAKKQPETPKTESEPA
ncbi:hypothetical protein [Variovorax sp. GT1P44]|uniref:hypothetical protein n=1 Tax=Variovorax sp. GT1P44 TaxID=3443742 RepID=UPI003F48C1CE